MSSDDGHQLVPFLSKFLKCQMSWVRGPSWESGIPSEKQRSQPSSFLAQVQIVSDHSVSEAGLAPGPGHGADWQRQQRPSPATAGPGLSWLAPRAAGGRTSSQLQSAQLGKTNYCFPASPCRHAGGLHLLTAVTRRAYEQTLGLRKFFRRCSIIPLTQRPCFAA